MLLVLAIINAGVREMVYEPRLGDAAGHAVSSIVAIAYTLAIAYWFVGHVRMGVTRADLLLVGGLWLTLTIAFEFGFGHYVMGRPWSYLLADYNVLKGRLWSFVLLTMFTAPSLWGYILEAHH